MKTVLPDGRVFETMPFLKIDYNPNEKVYKYTYETRDRTVKSSAGHTWGVWDKQTKDILMVKMDNINLEKHELLIQGWNDE